MIVENATIQLNSKSSSNTKEKTIVESSFKQQLHSLNETHNLDEESIQKVYAFRTLVARFVVESLIDNLLGKKSSNKKSNVQLPINTDSLIDQHNKQKFASQTIQTTFSMQSLHEYTKNDSLTFQTKATIQTNEKTIQIDLNIHYSTSFQEIIKEKLEVEKLIYIDPLVIQYDLSQEHFDILNSSMEFYFDIDNDGNEEILNFVQKGSGFLSLDKNENGKIDNGSELFGPSSNDGFEELGLYDEDKNNWIDQNDPIFNKLRIWTKDENGNDSLLALSQANVGAIYLQDIPSNFIYRKDIQSNLASLHSSSIFLSNDHKIGLVNAINYLKDQ